MAAVYEDDPQDVAVQPVAPVSAQTAPPQAVQQIANGLQSGTPDGRVQAAKLVNQKIEYDKNGEGHVNTHTDPIALFMAVMGGSASAIHKAYNGGPTWTEDAYAPAVGRILKEYNQRGTTGRMFTVNGQPLTAEQIAEIDKKGGAISRVDMTAASTPEFQATAAGIKETRLGLRKQILEAYTNASNVATAASNLNNLLEERINLTKDAKWMDIISKLPAKERQKLFTIASQSIQSSTSKGATTTTGQAASAGSGTNEQKGLGFNLGGKAGPGGETGGAGIAPKIGVDVSGTTGTGAQNQINSSARAGAEATAASSAGVQQQSALRNQIEGIIQGKINDKEFADIQRYIQLSGKIDEMQQSMQLSKIVPGATELPQTDPYLSGRQNAIITDLAGKRNGALAAAYESFVANEIHKNGGDLSSIDKQEMNQRFLNSNTAKGIIKRYDHYISEGKENKKIDIPEGTIWTNNQNRPEIRKNGKWESLNVR